MISKTFLTIHKNGRVTCDDNARIIKAREMIHEWKIGKIYKLCAYGITTGKFNNINQYEFPPPISSTLFYGDVFIIGLKKKDATYEVVDISKDIWKMFCRDIFQFESLRNSETEDEHEIDELNLVPLHLKTKHGYLKDGFVVDDDEEF